MAKRNQNDIYVETACQAVPAKIDKHPRQPARTSSAAILLPRFIFLFNKTRICDAELTEKVAPKLPNASSITATMELKRGVSCGFCGLTPKYPLFLR